MVFFLAAPVLVVLLAHNLLFAENAADPVAPSLPADFVKPARILIADDAVYAPLSFLDANGRPAGITIDIWKLWSSKTGIAVDFRLTQWDAALSAVQNGTADVVGSLLKTEDRQKIFDFTQPFYPITTSVYFHKQIHSVSGLADLQGFPVGTVKGDSAEKTILQRYPKTLLLRYPDTGALVSAAVEGGVKVFVADSEMARFYLAKYDQQGLFREASKRFASNQLHAGVKKGNTQLLAVLQDGFSRISAEEVNGIVSSWTGNPIFAHISWLDVLTVAAVIIVLVGLVVLWNIRLRKTVAKVLREAQHRNLKLHNSEARFKTFFDLAPFSCVVNDLQGRYRMVNNAFCDQLGLQEDAVIGQTGKQLGLFFDRDVHGEIVEALLRANEVTQWEVVFNAAQGPRYALYSSRLMEMDGEKLILSSTVDITDRKRAEEALKESENSFIQLFQSAPVPMAFASNVDGYRRTTWNDAWYQTFGYTREQAEGRRGSDIGLWSNSDDRSRFIEMVNSQHSVAGFEASLRRHDGSVRTCSLFGRFIEKSNHRLLMVVYLDVTERKHAEVALQESEERFSRAFSLTPAPMGITDFVTGRFIDVNEQLLQMIEYTRGETIGSTSFELGIWEDPEIRNRLAKKLKECGTFRDEPVRFITKTGTIKDVLWSAELINLGGYEAMLSLIYDFTQRKQAEDALRESESYNKVLFHDSHIPLAVLDPETCCFEDCNQAAVNIYGFSGRDELLGLMPKDVSVARQCDGQSSEVAFEEKIRRALEQGLAVFEWRYQRPNGETWDAEVHLMSFLHRDRQLIQFSLQDITGRKQAEVEKEKLQFQLLQSQKMESIGRLAGGVAHDFNNMLSVILGHTELAMNQMDQAQPLFGRLQDIRRAAQRSADLTRQLLAFARKQTVAPEVLDLNATMEGMLNMLRRLIGENIDLAWLPGKHLKSVNIDPSQIDQILVNLCVNARDAIADTGRITIETKMVTCNEAWCAEHTGGVPGAYVLLAVNDNGCGMDSETLSFVFEPFFTTKKTGEGTGLGLATVYGIVRQNNGFIDVDSEPNQGTTVKIYLPQHKGKDKHVSEKGPLETVASGHETILLAEDEPMILDMTTAMLKLQGYNILAAATPGEAIRLAREHAGAIDLLMTDVVMPEMNGRDLAKNLLSLYPDMKRLFMSGYTADVIAHHGVLDKGVHFIQKPFSLKDLAAKVRETLDEEKTMDIEETMA
jgi:PAS domain S-box-containing protein